MEIRRCNGKRMGTISKLTSASAGQQFARWLASHSSDAKLGVLCHSDADGIAAGAILHRALQRSRREVATIVTQKFENAWSESVRDRVQASAPGALIVCDLGVRARAVLDALPTCFIDHHHFSDAPLNGMVITGFQVEPCPTSGLIAFWCANAIADVSDLEWIAAISLLSDVGDRAPFAELTSAKSAHGLSALREATTLLNAARRSSRGDAEPALRLLSRAISPREISRSDSPDAMVLRQAQQEVNGAFTEAKRAAPKFSGRIAVVRIHTACQVHPLIAQIWRTRLPKYIVFCANTGYRDGFVHFSGRCGKETDLIAFLRDHAPVDAGDNYGCGHPQAAGGSLPVGVWNGWTAALGFGGEVAA
jgi:single-stranded-DNA-specific exonuclease